MNNHSERIAALSPEQREMLLQRLKEKQMAVESATAVFPPITPKPEDRYLPFPLTDVQAAYWISQSDLFDLSGVSNIYLEHEIVYKFPPLTTQTGYWSAVVGWLGQTVGRKYVENKISQLFVQRLNFGLNRLIERHDMLRAVIHPDGQQQVLAEIPLYQVKAINLRGKSAQQVETQLEQIREQLRYTKKPSDTWPLFDFVVCILDNRRIRLFIRIEPMIIDGSSRIDLLQELRHLLLEPQATLPELECTYRDYALAWAEFEKSDHFQKGKAYWFEQLSTMPPAPQLPQINPVDSSTAVRYDFFEPPPLAPDEWQRLKARAAKAGLSPSVIALAAFTEVLAARSLERRFTLGLIGTYHPPIHPQLEDVVGNFNNLSLLVVDNDSDTFEERAHKLWQQLSADLEYRFFPGHQVLRELNRRQGNSSKATIPIFFNSVIIDADAAYGALPELPEDDFFLIKDLEVGAYVPQLLLMVVLSESIAGELEAKWQVVKDVFPPDMIEEMVTAYRYVLKQLATNEASWHNTTEQLMPSVENKLTQIWERLLDTYPVAPTDNFYDVGGNSLLLVRLLNEIEEKISKKPSLQTFSENPTIQHLTTILEEAPLIERQEPKEEPKVETAPKENNNGFKTFIFIWASLIISALGSELTNFALGVWVFQLTGSITQFALISVFATLPGIVLSPLIGAYVDRWDRRWILIIADCVSALVTIGTAVLLLFNRLEIWHIYVATTVNSISGAFFQPAFSASVSLLVPKKHFGRSAGMLQAGFAAARILAPIMAGVLIVTIQLWGVLLIDFVTFIIAVTVLLVIRIPKPTPTSEGQAGKGAVQHEVSYGWRYITSRPGLFSLLIFFAFTNFTIGIVQVLITPMILSFSDAVILGRVLAVAAVGSLLGGIVMSIWGGPKRRIYGILGFTLFQGIILFMGGLRPSALLISVAAAIFLFCAQIIGGSSQAIWLSKVAPDVQGRVFSIRSMIAWSSLPIAYLIAGPLADNLFEPLLAIDGVLADSLGRLIGVGPGRGIGLIYIVMGVFTIITVILGFSYPRLRRVELELPDAVQTDETTQSSAPTTQAVRPTQSARSKDMQKQTIPVSQNTTRSVNMANPKMLLTVGVAFFITLFVFLGMYRLQPPSVVPETASLSTFSAERAGKHVEAIAQSPRPIGSPEQARVREYILAEFAALELTPEVQEASPLLELGNYAIPATYIVSTDLSNIVVRLEGTDDNAQAILVTTHYDSVVTSPNASDGGSSVAMILELARILSEGEPLKNDVIFLLTDAEERYLMGAKAFIEEHEFADDIGVILHFVARGSSGPSIMFETSPENGWLIEQFAEAAPRPVANSLAYEIYQLLPNNTDFSTVYREAGYPGLNFAYIDDAVHYHSLLDNPQNLDLRSLQHHGEYALALTQHFGNLNLEEVRDQDAVYFDVWGLTLIHYPVSWVIPFAVFIMLVYGGVIALGLRKKQLTLSGMGLGVLLCLLTVLISAGAIYLLQRIILALHPSYRLLFQGSLYNSAYYLGGFVFIILAITSLLYGLFQQKIQFKNLIAGGLTIWLITMLVISFTLPGGSYLFMWPLLFSLLAFGLILYRQHETLSVWPDIIILLLGSVPGLVLLIPTTYLLYISLPPLGRGGLFLAIAEVLLLALLIPHLILMTKPKMALPVITAVIGLLFLTGGSATAGFSPEQPKPNSIYYGYNADTDESVWMSAHRPDEWTEQFFTEGAERGSGTDFFIFRVDRNDWFIGPAPILPTASPEVTLLNDSVNEGTREMLIQATVPEPARALEVHVSLDPDNVQSIRVNDMETDIQFRPDDDWVSTIIYNIDPATGDSIDVSVKTTSLEPVTVIAVSVFDGLPQAEGFSFTPRPSSMIPAPVIEEIEESTIVRKTFHFAAPSD